MTCLDERRLLDLHYGDGSVADRTHVSRCSACAARLGALARDLGRIDTVVRSTPPRRASRLGLGWRLAPIAVAAALLLAVAVGRHDRVPAAPDDTLALGDELASTLEGDLWSDDIAEATASARSTCAWGDPLLGVGCNEPAVTQIVWR